MIKVIILMSMLSVSAKICAQSFDEWFRQNKTQLDYLRQQIAAVLSYAKATDDGYRIVQQGTGLIAGLKQDDYSLHKNNFDGLVSVRPALGRYTVIQSTIGLQGRLVSLAEETSKQAEVLTGWSTTVTAFFEVMLDDCLGDLELLDRLTTNGQAQMSDAERLTAIDRLYRRMQERYKAGVMMRETVIFLRNNIIV